MADVIFYCPDTAKLKAEAKKVLPGMCGETGDRFVIPNCARTVQNEAGATLSLVRNPPKDLNKLKSLVRLGTYEEVFRSEEKAKIYDSVYDRSSRSFEGDDGENVSYTPPERFAEFFDNPLTTDQAIDRVAEKRWMVETGGFEWEGIPFMSDDRSQLKFLGESSRIATGSRKDGEYWKCADGSFRPFTNAEFQSILVAGEQHVKKCFAVENACKVRIAKGETDVEKIWSEEWAK